MIRRFVAITAIGLGVALGSPGQAAAHGGGGADATNYRTDVLDTGAPGLAWTVYGGDALLAVRNQTGVQVIVEG